MTITELLFYVKIRRQRCRRPPPRCMAGRRGGVKRVFAKVGVSSRGELVARLFAEHYQEALHDSVVVFEDLHWIDSETQALLDSLVETLPAARVLLLVNYRPEYT